jgi:diguanylate cyclase (GGDEF)-like protein
MKNTELLMDKLRSLYFELASTPLEQSDANTLCRVAECICKVLPVSYSGFYLFNEWQREYELCISDSLIREVPLKEHRLSENVMMGEEVNHQIILEKQVTLLHILPQEGPKAILCMEQEFPTPVEELAILKTETEKLISLLQLDGRRMRRNHAYLFELTAHLLSLTSQKKILSEIVQGLRKLYPELAYNLLLSQDTELEAELPVKTIEYSDDVIKRVSTLAFISGEIQIEEQLDKTGCSLYAPLVGKQGVYGVLQVISDKGMYIPEKEINFISQIASTAGKAIENVTLYEKSNHLVSDLKLINEATHKLNSNLEMKEIINLVREQVMDVCHASEVGFIYYNGDNEERFDVLTGSTAFFNTNPGRRFAEYLKDHTDCNGEPLLKGDFDRIDRFPYRSIIAIPMSHSDTVHGIIAILHEQPYFFSFNTFKLIQSLIQHSTLALTNTVLKDKLKKAVKTDFLTKLYSRNYLEEEIIAHMATGEMGTLILFDIDDFKSINDTYGHHIGDKVLIQVADLVKSIVNNRDLAARWGGEELAVYAPTITINEGVQIAGLIRSQVEKHTNPSVTLSCGVSSWEHTVTDTVSELFIRADKALYEAKNNGKNSVVRYVKNKS